jgi:hypothetical protein
MAKPDHRDPDVDSALDLIVGDTPAPMSVLPTTTTGTAREQKREPVTTTDRAQRTAAGRRTAPNAGHRPKARTGRPPGSLAQERKLKDKTSLALDLELMDRYRKQSWKEECQLGELVERALREYAITKWGWKLSS